MKRLLSLLNQTGQTAVEYLLVTAVSITLGITFTKKVSGILVDNPNSFIGGYIRRYDQLLNNDRGGRPYKTFQVQRAASRRR